jgi:DMSO/TMAO reductase YedYZ molybdopterin-dependent catalytic subunit
MPTDSNTEAPGHWLSILAGWLSVGAALAVATLVAALGSSLRSPIFDVGDRFIEVTPAWLKDLAISLFDTNDKAALLTGIGLSIVLLAGAAGWLAMRWRLWSGVALVAVFGVVGMASALGGSRGPEAIVPSLAGAISGILLLGWFHRLWYRADAGTTADGSDSRRRLLFGLGGAGLGVGLVGGLGVVLGRRFDISSTIAGGSLPGVASPLAALPEGAGLSVPGLSSFITPNVGFYRIDTALSVPQIRAEDYQLRIHGMVKREVNLSYQDLLKRAQVESDITLTCVSNEVGGRLVGNARWQGVRLDALLAEAGVETGADQVVGRSYDGYTCGFPVEVVGDGRDVLIALGMNGEPLPLEHGYPARLVVPGLYGYVSATKWLHEIEITTFDVFDSYWVPRGWAAQAPIKTSSRIDTPTAFEQVPTGEGVIAGVAWAQTRGITKVEVQVDGGDWLEAELSVEVNNTTWRQWKVPWQVTSGRHDITVRATDATGEVQTEERARPMPDGSTGWHSVVAIGVSA